MTALAMDDLDRLKGILELDLHDTGILDRAIGWAVQRRHPSADPNAIALLQVHRAKAEIQQVLAMPCQLQPLSG